MGRTEFLTCNDYDASLGWNGTSSARAKWRSLLSACGSVVEMGLTPPTLSETPVNVSYRMTLVPHSALE